MSSQHDRFGKEGRPAALHKVPHRTLREGGPTRKNECPPTHRHALREKKSGILGQVGDQGYDPCLFLNKQMGFFSCPRSIDVRIAV